MARRNRTEIVVADQVGVYHCIQRVGRGPASGRGLAARLALEPSGIRAPGPFLTPCAHPLDLGQFSRAVARQTSLHDPECAHFHPSVHEPRVRIPTSDASQSSA